MTGRFEPVPRHTGDASARWRRQQQQQQQQPPSHQPMFICSGSFRFSLRHIHQTVQFKRPMCPFRQPSLFPPAAAAREGLVLPAANTRPTRRTRPRALHAEAKRAHAQIARSAAGRTPRLARSWSGTNSFRRCKRFRIVQQAAAMLTQTIPSVATKAPSWIKKIRYRSSLDC
jgi:hypothetical protein